MIRLENLNLKRRIDIRFLNKVAYLAAGEIWPKPSAANIVFVGNHKIRALNRRYLSRDRSTDVIAFPAPEEDSAVFHCGDEKAFFRGDIAISSDKAFQNAGTYGTSFKEELARYIIHGLLHLKGYEDTSAIKKKAMKKREEKLVRKIRQIR